MHQAKGPPSKGEHQKWHSETIRNLDTARYLVLKSLNKERQVIHFLNESGRGNGPALTERVVLILDPISNNQNDVGRERWSWLRSGIEEGDGRSGGVKALIILTGVRDRVIGIQNEGTGHRSEDGVVFKYQEVRFEEEVVGKDARVIPFPVSATRFVVDETPILPPGLSVPLPRVGFETVLNCVAMLCDSLHVK